MKAPLPERRGRVKVSRRSLVQGLGALALSGCRRREVVAVPRLRATTAGPAVPVQTPVSLVLASAPEPLARQLVEALREVLEARERQGTALDLGLDEGPVDEPLRPLRPWALPAWTAARALVANRHPVLGGPVVEVVAPGEGGEAPGVWGPAGASGDVARWRLAAWPVSRALWLRTDRATAASLAGEFRERLPSPEVPYALVIDHATRRHERGAVPDELTAVARRLVRRLREPLPGSLGALLSSLAGPVEAAVLPFVPLAEGDLLLVPRQGKLGRPQGLRDAVRSVVGTRAVRLVGPDQPEPGPVG